MTSTFRVAPPSTFDKPPPDSAFSSWHVEVVVGSGRSAEKFYVHKDILSFYSGYFKAALNGSFIESQDMRVELKSEDPATFRRAVVWMYTGRLLQADSSDLSYKHWDFWPKLWVFGDAHLIPLLQNEVINLWHKSVLTKWHNTSRQVPYIYNNTEMSAKLRHWAVDIMAALSDAKSCKTLEIMETWPVEALVDLLKRVWLKSWERQDKGQVQEWDLCKYHIHEDGVKCETKGSTEEPPAKRARHS